MSLLQTLQSNAPITSWRNLVYIRDILGHVSVQTTEIYARADSMQKRKALEKAYVNVTPDQEPEWLKSDSLITWLQRL